MLTTHSPTSQLSLERLRPILRRKLGLSGDQLHQAFRPAVEGDLPRILALRRVVMAGGQWWDDERFVRWRYFDPVFGARSLLHVFEHRDEIVGAVGLEPVILAIDGVAHSASRCQEMMVRPDFHGRGIGGCMMVMLRENHPVLTITGSNRNSHKLLTRACRHVLNLHTWKALIRSRPYLERYVGRLPARVLSPTGDVLLTLDRRLRRRRGRPDLEVRSLVQFDEQADRLSAACETPGRVLVRRSGGYLNWRFIRNPRCRYKAIGGFRDGRLVGYVVTRFNLVGPNPRPQGDIVDWLEESSAEPESSALPELLAEALDGLIREGAGVVSCLASRLAAPRAFLANGFRERDDEPVAFFMHARPPELNARLGRASDWYLTAGDFDVE